MHCGIEFEYLMVDMAGPLAGRVRDFSNLDYLVIRSILENKPGRDDPGLATGDLGIKSGYWYLEGDERFHEDGRFHTLAVKGVEIRTPPRPGIAEAIESLLSIEKQLIPVLADHGLGLAVVGFNPVHPGYTFTPPLNPWEMDLRRRHRSYDGSLVSTMSYGPDINLSMPGWLPDQCLDVARKLNHYSPYLVPFSFSSPFSGGGLWPGCSKRTYERAGRRPAVKLFLDANGLHELRSLSGLVHPARLPGEAGRIEFKAFDAMPSLAILTACCHLLVGVCLADDLTGRSEGCDPALYRRGAMAGFNDDDIRRGAAALLDKARIALDRTGTVSGTDALAPLMQLLRERRTPAEDLVASWQETGLAYRPGAFFQHLNAEAYDYA